MSTKSGWRNKTLHFLARNFTSHILLYHSCFPKIPEDIGPNLHNVTPENLYRQLNWYKQHFDIVSLEEWFNAKIRRGLVAVTFDDAYKSVFDYGKEVLEILNVPATVFIIGCTLEGKIFWRDKIRYLQGNGLADEFLQYLSDKGSFQGDIRDKNFYTASKGKAFEEKLSNSQLDLELDTFLEIKNLANSMNRYCIESKKEIIDHPLISYGNHSYHHYMLSTLAYYDQKKDLRKSNQLISDAAKPGKFQKILSVPFGGVNAYNTDTVKACNELKFDAILLSTHSVNGIGRLKKEDGLPVAQRYMVPDDFELMKDQVRDMTYNQFKRYKPGSG